MKWWIDFPLRSNWILAARSRAEPGTRPFRDMDDSPHFSHSLSFSVLVWHFRISRDRHSAIQYFPIFRRGLDRLHHCNITVPYGRQHVIPTTNSNLFTAIKPYFRNIKLHADDIEIDYLLHSGKPENTIVEVAKQLGTPRYFFIFAPCRWGASTLKLANLFFREP